MSAIVNEKTLIPFGMVIGASSFVFWFSTQISRIDSAQADIQKLKEEQSQVISKLDSIKERLVRIESLLEKRRDGR